MKTKDIFNFRRFGRYFVSDLRSGASNYGLSLLALALLTPAATYALITGFGLLFGNGWNGPDMGGRAFIFAIAMFCLIVTMPVKCYGRITEKQYGSFWLTLPASRLEKVLSMVLITCVIAPLAGAALYFGLDALICLLDRTCGGSLAVGLIRLIQGMGDLNGALADAQFNLGTMDITVENGTEEMFRQLSSPWLYIDELFCMTLPFLLGAIFFKRSKTVKTFLAIAVFSTAISALATPLMISCFSNVFSGMTEETEIAETLLNSGLIKNLALIDIVSDTVMNLALLAGIWFRVKTLKH